jgi:O-antigen/teichoic acid export membrane protein
MAISLYTSRVILDALGVNDYGIYNIVGGFVSMFALVSSALTSACTRFLNVEIGRGDSKGKSNVFSTAVLIQCSLAVIVALIGETIGLWYVNNVMVLSPERLNSANWCFQFSVISFCLNLVSVPYSASIVAHEKMSAFAYVSLFQGGANLIISYLVYLELFDRLVFYALMLLIVQLIVIITYFTYCTRQFKECRFRTSFDRLLLRKMLSYSIWHLLGNGANVLKVHGVNLVLNLFYGTTVNAARGITTQVNNAIHQFSGNFMMAMNPQITQSYASNDFDYMFKLIKNGSRYSFYLLFLLSLPIVINADLILGLWLKEVPKYTVIFVQLTLISSIINALSIPLITAQNATGNVRNYQLVVGSINLLNLPLSYVVLKCGYSPASVVIVSIGIEIIALFVRLYMIPLTIKDFKPKVFFNEVIIRCLVVSIVPIFVALIVHTILPLDYFTCLENIFVCIIMSFLSIFYFGCSKEEQAMIVSKVKSIVLNKRM